MSYESKINLVKQVIENHNQNAEEKKKVSFEKFLEILQQMGGTTEEALSLCTWEDLETCGLPRLIARQVTQNILRKSDSQMDYQKIDSSDGIVYISDKKAQQMPIKQLVEYYNPKNAKNAVGRRLKELTSGRRCVVFKTDGKINVDETVKMIDDLANGLAELEMTYVNGVPTNVYKIGDRQDLFADENPLYPGRALRSGGTCDQTGRSWEGVAQNIRQLLYIAVMDTKELKISQLDDAHSALDKAVSQTAESLIISRYPKASLRYQELAKVGKLPILKIKLMGNSGSSDKPNNPFCVQNKEF